ncbi:MAG TPA: nucleotide exchange factor GrpE [Woeseiaceae bacterium]|nr:nucleotide exchange factor GrpE [Woeseiaceae bacterium]
MSVKPNSSSDDAHYDRSAESEMDNPEEPSGPADAAPPAAEVTAVAALKAKADEHWDKYLRAAAELENVRKRAARDMDNARKFALERFATELLAVRDSLEMGLQAADGAGAAELIEGNRATLKQLVATMERFGVAEVDPEGEPFDPALHEAMTMQPSAEVEPNTVLTVFQKGYTLNGRLLRPARVVVAAAPGHPQ